MFARILRRLGVVGEAFALRVVRRAHFLQRLVHRLQRLLDFGAFLRLLPLLCWPLLPELEPLETPL